jgi:Mg-chelatase subunit ChlD
MRRACILRTELNPRVVATLPLVLLLLFFAFASPPPANADGELGVSVREVAVDDSALVQFLAKVVDANGRPLRLSGANSFSVRVGEQDIPVTGVQTVTDAAVGISALLVIDTSGSMIGAPLAAAQSAAAQYVRSLQPNDEVSVVAFSNQSNVIADFSTDFAAVEGQLSGLRPFGDTALYTGVNDAAARMAARPAARRVVIFLSDGADFGISNVSRDASLQAAADGGTPFYVIGLGPTIDAPYLQDLAAATGGAYFAAPSSDQLAGLFGEIAELLRSEYVVTVDFAGSGLGGDTNAVVRAESGDQNGEVAISLALPALPVAPQVRPTQQAPIIPQPVQLPEPPPEPESDSASVPIVPLLVLAIAGLVAWVVWRRWKRRKPEAYVFGEAPVFTPRDALPEPVARDAPAAVLRLDSGEEFRLEGVATIGIDPGTTHQLPLTRAEFGNAELRVWFANQRYVIRDAAPRTRMRVNGRATAWSFLSDGDEIDIRGVKLHFALADAVPSTSEG